MPKGKAKPQAKAKKKQRVSQSAGADASHGPLNEGPVLQLQESTTLETFKLWSLQSLQSFLSVRNKSLCGSFDELAARFVNHETSSVTHSWM